MHDFWTPRLIARAAPEAKLLIMFRDPIERFRSGVPHRISRTPDARIEAATADAIERGRYATQLRRVLACHDESKLLILQYEKCVADPAAQYRRTLAFLGVDPEHEHDGFERAARHDAGGAKKPLWDDLMDGLRAVLEPEVLALAALTPEIDVSLWKNFAHARAPHEWLGGEPARPTSSASARSARAPAGGTRCCSRTRRSSRRRRARRALHFFDRFCSQEMTDADVAAYHARFPRRPGTISGEWTGRYMFDAWTPPLLGAPRPDAKLLVMLSDPIERYRAVFTRADGERRRGPAAVHDRRRRPPQLRRSARAAASLLRPGADPRAAVRALPPRPTRPVPAHARVPRRARHGVRAAAAARGAPRAGCWRASPRAAWASGSPGGRWSSGRRRRSGRTSRRPCTPRSTRTWRRSASSCPSSI